MEGGEREGQNVMPRFPVHPTLAAEEQAPADSLDPRRLFVYPHIARSIQADVKLEQSFFVARAVD